MTATQPVPASPRATAEPPVRVPVGVARLLVLHVVAGVALFAVPQLATPLAVLVLGRVVVTCLVTERLEDVLVAASYAVGTEVLWRMTGAMVPWEVTKYLLVLVAVVTFSRFGLRRRSWAPVLAIGLLVPGSLWVVVEQPLDDAREALISNVLGLVALALVVLTCASIVATRQAASRVLWAVVVSLIPMATYVGLTLLTAAEVSFGDESEFVASGNFGPNQVSTALSFGLLAVYLLLVVLGDQRRVLLLAVGGWFLVAMLLTFSRGGLVSFLVPALLVVAATLADARRVLLTIAVAVLGTILVVGVLLPQLDQYTGGAMSARFSDTDTAHRSDIADSDWKIFVEHPVVGVGPGRSPELRGAGPAEGRQSHVAYTRLLSEHGLLGAGVLGCLAAIVATALRRATGRRAVAWSLALLSWAAVTMAHADVRLGAVSFAFGLACLAVRFDEPSGAVGAEDRNAVRNPRESRV